MYAKCPGIQFEVVELGIIWMDIFVSTTEMYAIAISRSSYEKTTSGWMGKRQLVRILQTIIYDKKICL
jgi:hypothetical protein